MMLPLVKALAPHLQAEWAGLESGTAPMLERVTPVTADLLRWWFQQDCCDGRGVNFHDGQRQAILHAIYAHEILQPETLVDLYQKLAAEDLLGREGQSSESSILSSLMDQTISIIKQYWIPTLSGSAS